MRGNQAAARASDGLHVDAERVVHETIEGETLVINLTTGTYYSLDGSGAEVWELLATGQDIGLAAAEIARRYPDRSDEAGAEVRRFAEELLAEELLSPGPGKTEPSPLPDGNHGESFEPPVLKSYTDMQYFLLLDPIHEVDDAAGWPHAADQAAVEGA
jgi:hypothetical protein